MTQDYIARKRAKGKSTNEAIRCLSDISLAVDGTTPAEAAARVQAAVERLHTAGE